MKLRILATFFAMCTLGVYTAHAQKPRAASTKPATSKMVEITTDYGKIKIRLYNETPAHRDNFIKLAKEGFYNDLLFHRVIKGFMIQGGDPTSKGAAPDKQLGMGDNGYTIPAEFNKNLIHKKGALCAARTGNPQKASSGCQFYIVQGNIMTDAQLDQMEQQKGFKYTEAQRAIYKKMGGTPMLDQDYTVYGEVVEGLDVIDKIAAVKTAPGDRPVKDVKMKVRVIE